MLRNFFIYISVDTLLFTIRRLIERYFLNEVLLYAVKFKILLYFYISLLVSHLQSNWFQNLETKIKIIQMEILIGCYIHSQQFIDASTHLNNNAMYLKPILDYFLRIHESYFKK